MPAAHRSPYADLMQRLAELPISAYERQQAQSQARLAFGLVDALCDGYAALRDWFAPRRRHAVR